MRARAGLWLALRIGSLAKGSINRKLAKAMVTVGDWHENRPHRRRRACGITAGD
jgi:hypothetical protein